MKIMHINSYFANRFFYQKLYDEQRKENELLIIIPAEFGFIEKYNYDETVKMAKCYYRFERFIHIVRLNKIVKYIEKNFNVADYDLIHAHSLFTNGMIAYMLAKKYRKPYIVNVRNVDINIFFKYIVPYWKVGRNILNEAEKVVFLSQCYKSKVLFKYDKRIDESKCTVIPNGVDKFWIENKFDFIRKVSKDKVNILYVGDINKNKNLVTVARAIEQLANFGVNVSYRIVGKIQDQAVADELQKYSFITIVQYVEKEILIEYYRKADIYVMASYTESFGLTYVEALSQALPIIYTEGQGFDGQFPEGFVGYHVNPKSYEDICMKIRMIIDKYEMISENCIKSVEKYKWEKIAEEYQIVYKEAVAENRLAL